MLPKRARLTSLEVSEVLKKGRTIRGQFLYLKYSSGIKSLKIAAVVSKSVARDAVKRNKLRRVLYRALQNKYCADIQAKKTGNAVVFMQKIPLQDTINSTIGDMQQLLLKI